MTLEADRFAGCLIGQCLGDALGFLVEGEPPPYCAAYVRDFVRPRRRPELTRDGFVFGQYSDDSQLARELMRSFVACEGFDPADYAGRIARLFADDLVVGRGHTTEQAALRLARGVAWDRAGTPAPAAGNGSAMRAGPVGLLFHDQPERLIRVAYDQGRITHADPRCGAGAVAIAGAVALAAQDGPIDPARFLETLQRWTTPIEPIVGTALRQLRNHLELGPEQAAEHISRAGLPPGVDSHWRGGISAFVVASVLWALYAFLRSPDDYMDTIATAIWPGGDVDTTAAMAGAIAGARLGLGAIPADLAAALNDRGTWDRDALVELARQCWRGTRRQGGG